AKLACVHRRKEVAPEKREEDERTGAKDDEQDAHEGAMTERPGQRVVVPDMQLFKDSVESLADAPDDVAAWRGGGRRIWLIVSSGDARRVTGSASVKLDLAREQISDERGHESAREQVRG